MKAQVSYDQLRQYLIDNKIIQGFGEALGNTLKPTMMIFPAKEWCRAMGYVDGSNNPDYEKALQNSDLRDMITLFEGFMAEKASAENPFHTFGTHCRSEGRGSQWWRDEEKP